VLTSASLLRSRSSTLPRGIPTNPNAARPAAQKGEASVIALAVIVLTELIVGCIQRYVLSVAKNVKCLSSLGRAGPYIAVIATGRLN
jgi:hypothetical protein